MRSSNIFFLLPLNQRCILIVYGLFVPSNYAQSCSHYTFNPLSFQVFVWVCSPCVPTIHSAPNHILGSGWTSFGLCNGYAGECVQGWNLKLNYVFSHQCVPGGCKAHYKLLLTWWLSAKAGLLMSLASLWRKARFIFQRVMLLVRPCFMFLQWCQYLSQDSIPTGHHPGIDLKMLLYVNSNQ